MRIYTRLRQRCLPLKRHCPGIAWTPSHGGKHNHSWIPKASAGMSLCHSGEGTRASAPQFDDSTIGLLPNDSTEPAAGVSRVE